MKNCPTLLARFNQVAGLPRLLRAYKCLLFISSHIMSVLNFWFLPFRTPLYVFWLCISGRGIFGIGASMMKRHRGAFGRGLGGLNKHTCGHCVAYIYQNTYYISLNYCHRSEQCDLVSGVFQKWNDSSESLILSSNQEASHDINIALDVAIQSNNILKMISLRLIQRDGNDYSNPKIWRSFIVALSLQIMDLKTTDEKY